MAPLEKEVRYYFQELPRLLKEHRGQFVLIHGENVDSFWETEDQAYEAGCKQFGIELFLVMPVVEAEEPIRLHFDVTYLPYPVPEIRAQH